MNVFNRLIVSILAAVLVCSGVFVLAGVFGLLRDLTNNSTPILSSGIARLQDLSGLTQIWVVVGSTFATVLGLVVLALEVRSPGRVRELVIEADSSGEVAVSVAGLRRLAEHVVGQINGVERTNCLAHPSRRGLVFDCHLQVRPDTNAKQIADLTRESLAAAVENHIGQAPVRIHIRTQIGTPSISRKRVR